MKARIEGARFTERGVNLRVAFYYSEDEKGYDECKQDILDRNGYSTGEKQLFPFNTIDVPITPDITTNQLRSEIISRIEKFKKFSNTAHDMLSHIGLEFEVR